MPCPPARPLTPPVVYLQEIPEPKFRGRTNAELLAWALELRQQLRLANADKKALTGWLNAAAESSSLPAQPANVESP